MLASNFAVALAKESGQKTLLIDLDLPLGDAALNLGIAAEFSAIDALQQADRLDAQFLASASGQAQLGALGAGGAGTVSFSSRPTTKASTGF